MRVSNSWSSSIFSAQEDAGSAFSLAQIPGWRGYMGEEIPSYFTVRRLRLVSAWHCWRTQRPPECGRDCGLSAAHFSAASGGQLGLDPLW